MENDNCAQETKWFRKIENRSDRKEFIDKKGFTLHVVDSGKEAAYSKAKSLEVWTMLLTLNKNKNYMTKFINKLFYQMNTEIYRSIGNSLSLKLFDNGLNHVTIWGREMTWIHKMIKKYSKFINDYYKNNDNLILIAFMSYTYKTGIQYVSEIVETMGLSIANTNKIFEDACQNELKRCNLSKVKELIKEIDGSIQPNWKQIWKIEDCNSGSNYRTQRTYANLTQEEYVTKKLNDYMLTFVIIKTNDENSNVEQSDNINNNKHFVNLNISVTYLPVLNAKEEKWVSIY
jgi:hypothetical protein